VVTRIIIIIALGTLLAGCAGRPASGTDRDRLGVVAGLYPLAYAAGRVGGARVDVRNLTPPGAEPHDFELSPRDVEAVRSAALVLYLGRGFQPALEDAVRGASGRAVDLLGGLPLRGGDPHVWLDPLLFAQIAERIAHELGPPASASALVADLRALDREYARGLAHCARRTIVTSHEAFAYLAARYRLRQVAVSGISPEAEPAPRDLERAVDAVRASGATTVFFEPLVSPRIAAVVAREAGVRTAVLDPLEGLSEDEIARGEDYFSLMRTNLAALEGALGCR
jgi:zinc transport system substrate-binding protein